MKKSENRPYAVGSSATLVTYSSVISSFLLSFSALKLTDGVYHFPLTFFAFDAVVVMQIMAEYSQLIFPTGLSVHFYVVLLVNFLGEVGELNILYDCFFAIIQFVN